MAIHYMSHAAALRQVRNYEFYLLEAVLTTAIGTSPLHVVALLNGVSRIIRRSTDKSTRMMNAIWNFKALCKKVMLANSRRADASQSPICGTRYGDVKASRRWVTRLFINRIHNSLLIAAANPPMTRSMVAMEDAVEMVLYPHNEGNLGESFVQTAPASTFGDFAVAARHPFGKPYDLTKVISTGHCEKLYEPRLTPEDLVHAEYLVGCYWLVRDNRGLNWGRYIKEGERKVIEMLDDKSCNRAYLDVQERMSLLTNIWSVQVQTEDCRAEPGA